MSGTIFREDRGTFRIVRKAFRMDGTISRMVRKTFRLVRETFRIVRNIDETEFQAP